MSREARKISGTGIYHTMLRGINKQQIFEDTEDYEKFLQIIYECKEIDNFKVYAYCLMGNHIHLLIKVNDISIASIFKRIAGKFVYWYNIKYKRCGHLFQDRFKSEAVEDDEYLMTVLRYIHQNPVKARICKKTEDYKYSSYNEYITSSYIVDTDFCLNIMGLNEFISYNNENNNDCCLEMLETSMLRVTDEQAKEIVYKVSQCSSISEFQKLDIKHRDNCLKKLRDKGLSIRQISRLTGTSFGVVRKMCI